MMFSKIVGFKLFIASAMIFSSADFVPSYAHDLRGNAAQTFVVTGNTVEETYKRKLQLFNDISNAYNKIGRFISAEDQGCLSLAKNSTIFTEFLNDFDKAKAAMHGTPLDYNKDGKASARWVREQMYPTMKQAHSEMLDAFAVLTKEQKNDLNCSSESDSSPSKLPVTVPTDNKPKCESAPKSEEQSGENNNNLITRIYLYIWNAQKTVADLNDGSQRVAPPAADTKPNPSQDVTKRNNQNVVISVPPRPPAVAGYKHSDKKC